MTELLARKELGTVGESVSHGAAALEGLGDVLLGGLLNSFLGGTVAVRLASG